MGFRLWLALVSIATVGPAAPQGQGGLCIPTVLGEASLVGTVCLDSVPPVRGVEAVGRRAAASVAPGSAGRGRPEPHLIINLGKLHLVRSKDWQEAARQCDGRKALVNLNKRSEKTGRRQCPPCADKGRSRVLTLSGQLLPLGRGRLSRGCGSPQVAGGCPKHGLRETDLGRGAGSEEPTLPGGAPFLARPWGSCPSCLGP